MEDGIMHEFASQKDFVHHKSKIKIIEEFIHSLDKRCDVIVNEQSHLKENFTKMEFHLNKTISNLEIRFDRLDDNIKKISDYLSEKRGGIITRDKFWKSITAFMTIVAALGIFDHFFKFISFVIK